MRAFGSMWRYGTTSGCKLEGHLKSLGADMQQPTECRKDEGTRVRRVAPKLIANGESRRPLRARGLRIGPSRGSEACGDGEEGGGLVGGGARAPRDCGKTRGKNPQS